MAGKLLDSSSRPAEHTYASGCKPNVKTSSAPSTAITGKWLSKAPAPPRTNLLPSFYGGPSRIRTYDFHRVNQVT